MNLWLWSTDQALMEFTKSNEILTWHIGLQSYNIKKYCDLKEIAALLLQKLILGIIYWVELKILWLWVYKFGITSDKASNDIIMTDHFMILEK
jgi:hypothetical protein